MKKLYFILILSFLIACFSSCSTHVDLYADYKDVPIVYAMLNYQADTNYVKIIRAFCGTNDHPIDATEVALIADSNNYPGKLDARIVELQNTSGNHYEPTGRVLELDTMTLHDKEEGAFYAPDQKIYFTSEKLQTNSDGNKYKYRLVVVKPDGDTLTAQTSMVGNEEFRIMTGSVNFQVATTDALGQIMFRADGAAALYEVTIQFNYLEQLAGQAMKRKNVSRSFGIRTLNGFKKLEGSTNTYFLEYGENWLFVALKEAIGSDTIVNPNHPNVVRYIDDFVITISAAGEDLYYYYVSSEAQENSLGGLVSPCSNIEGGFGLFSSRTTIKKEAKLSAFTKIDLFGMDAWGFKEQ